MKEDQLKCKYADCELQLTEIDDGLCLCPNDHTYHVWTRGQGTIVDYAPASSRERRLAIEIRGLRRQLAEPPDAVVEIDRLKAELEACQKHNDILADRNKDLMARIEAERAKAATLPTPDPSAPRPFRYWSAMAQRQRYGVYDPSEDRHCITGASGDYPGNPEKEDYTDFRWLDQKPPGAAETKGG